jgi:hypothetical protein
MFAKTLVAGAMLLLPVGAAYADTDRPGDADSIWTIRAENDVISTLPHGSDQNYSAGQQVGWTSGVQAVPEFAAGWAQSLWGDGTTRVGLGITQQIYTPIDKTRIVPDPRDRPYAGYLAVTGSLMHDTANTRDFLALSLGVTGPFAQGEEAQNGFHGLIKDANAKGWSHQLPNEAAVEVLDQRTWRLPVGSVIGIEADVLPAVAIGVGTVRDYLQVATVLRIGQGLDHDFGASRIRPGISGGDAFADSNQVTWYVFGGVSGQGVARDAFLDGTLFTHSAHVQRIPFVGEMEGGVALMWRGVRLTYVQTWQTTSFRHQGGGLFSFGSLAMSVRF